MMPKTKERNKPKRTSNLIKKNTSIFQNEFKDYDNIRRLIHHIYLYGIYSATDIVNSKLIEAENRTIKDYIRRIKNSIIQMNNSAGLHVPIANHAIPNRKKDKNSLRFSNDFILAPGNPLFGTYRQHTISIKDLYFYLYLFTILSLGDVNPYECLDLSEDGNAYEECSDAAKYFMKFNAKDNFTCDDVLDVIGTAFDANCYAIMELEKDRWKNTNLSIPEFVLSKAECRARLNEMVTLGLLTVVDDEKADTPDKKHSSIHHTKYAPVKSILSTNTDDNSSNLYDLLEYIKYSSIYSPVSVPGYLLADKLDNYLIAFDYSRKSNSINNNFTQNNKLFIYENTGIINTVDDQQCLELIEFIDTRTLIRIQYQTNNYEDQKEHVIHPLKIAIDNTYGRHYLVALQYKKVLKTIKHNETTDEYSPESITTFRIDRIVSSEAASDISLTAKASPELIDMIYSAYPRLKEYSFNVNTASDLSSLKHNDNSKSKHKTKAQTVSIDFDFSDSSFDQYLKDKLLAQPNINTRLTTISANRYHYEINLTDPYEIVPWVNSFGACAKINGTVSEVFSSIITDQTLEVLSFYESV